MVVEEEKKALKSEAGDRFLTSEPRFRGTPKACDTFSARGQNVSRLEFGGGEFRRHVICAQHVGKTRRVWSSGSENRGIQMKCDRISARGPKRVALIVITWEST